MDDPFDLKRFVDAQDPVYSQVREELRGGRKKGHWMWFIFPQLRGLGSSAMATAFGISSSKEAVSNLDHPVLGARLGECTQLVNSVQDGSVDQIFAYPDNLKFRSSMTLFANVASDNQVFLDALRKYLNGEPDPRTMDRL